MKKSALSILLTLLTTIFTSGSYADVIANFDQRLFGIPTTATLPWGGGWSVIAPFSLPQDASSYYIIYNGTTGQVHFDAISKGATGFETRFEANWAPGWTHFVPFKMNGGSYFIAYNQTTGEVHFDQFNSGATGFSIKWIGKWGSGWSNLNVFYVNDKPALMAYNKTTGVVHFDWINQSLNGTQGVSALQWGTGWDQFVLFSNTPNVTKMFAYDSDTGQLHYDTIFNNLNGVQTTNAVTREKGLIVSVVQNLDENANRIAKLLLYSPSTGDLSQHFITDTLLGFSKKTNWPKNLTHLTSFFLMDVLPFDGGILTYSQTHGKSRFYRVNDRSKLSCNGIKKCEFKKLPLLNQMDANIPDAPYFDAKRFGCYDTSITMVMAGAFGNAKLSGDAAVWTRSHTYRNLMLNSTATPYLLTKFQYDTAMAKLPFYFSEILVNYDSQSVVKVPSDCDLLVYGSCAAAENKFGDFSRRWVDAGTELKEEDLIENILVGAVQVVAYNWSENTIAGSFRVIKDNPKSPHKVVIAGFDKNHTFPLLINNPGAGTRDRARIWTIEKNPWITLIDGNGSALAKRLVIEFENAPGNYNFIEHIDHFRLY